MLNLLAYSGITTKIKAMSAALIKDSEFCDMAQMDRVSDAVEYLKSKAPYSDILKTLNNDELHRSMIEDHLTLSLYHDFTRIYRFSNLRQRQFLDLYLLNFEITILKKCLRNIASHQNWKSGLTLFQDFFEKNSNLDIKKIANATSLEEFFLSLEGSDYFPLLQLVQNKTDISLFDYEMQFDLYYFHSIAKIHAKDLSKKERLLLQKCNGTKLDLLNIQWIYRSKKYYHLSKSQIYALIIPLPYRLTQSQITQLVESSSAEEFYQALRPTYYGQLLLPEQASAPDLERLYEKTLNQVYRQTSKQSPYSIAILNSYLYFKEIEIQKIITILEGIRYGLKPEVINSYVIKI